MKYLTLFLLALLVASPLMAQDNGQQDPQAVLASFQEFAATHIASYEPDGRTKLSKRGGGWTFTRYTPEPEYGVDVRTTNSLVSPYVAYLEFTLAEEYSDFHDLEEEASTDTVMVASRRQTHRHEYAFQNGKWVVTEREHMNHGDILGLEWYSCDPIDGSDEDVSGCKELFLEE